MQQRVHCPRTPYAGETLPHKRRDSATLLLTASRFRCILTVASESSIRAASNTCNNKVGAGSVRPRGQHARLQRRHGPIAGPSTRWRCAACVCAIPVKGLRDNPYWLLPYSIVGLVRVLVSCSGRSRGTKWVRACRGCACVRACVGLLVCKRRLFVGFVSDDSPNRL
jgi:hypothetical protein